MASACSGSSGSAGSSSGSGPSGPQTPESPPAASARNEDAVFEAVFLYELGRAQLAPDEAACLRTRGATNDGSALLARIQARFSTAIADAECSGGGPQGPVKVAATGGKAARFDIGPVEWLDDSHAKIASGGAHRGGGARETILQVEKTNDGWKITGESPGMMM